MNYLFNRLLLLVACYFTSNNSVFVYGEENIDHGKYHVKYLDRPGIKYQYHASRSQLQPLLQIYCYKGKEKAFIYMWETVVLEVSLSNEDYEYYEGSTPQSVISEYEVHRSSWKLELFNSYTWKNKVIRFNPFNTSCIGIHSMSEGYNVTLQLTRVDFWRVLIFVSGIALYIYAPELGGNSLFFYVCGITLGICSSLLILVYFVSKLVPRGPVMYGFIVGGWAVGVCLLQLMYDNLRLIVMEYQSQVLMYILTTGLVSFVVCYRMGPVTDPRSKNLIQWALQGAGVLMIYFSSEFHEAMIMVFLSFVMSWHYLSTIKLKVQSFWYKRYPPKPRLLSNEEYHAQASRETEKALKQLRVHCSSPEVNTWDIVKRLSRADRFAEFVGGGGHLDDVDMVNYISADSEDLLDVTDDESD